MNALFPSRILRGLAGIILALLGLAAIGLFAPSIPVLGEVGPLLMASHGPWISILALVGAIWAGVRWRRNRRRMAFVVALLALTATLGMTFGQLRQISVAQANDVKIDLAQALLASGQAVGSAVPQTIIYARQGGQDLPIDIYKPVGAASGRSAPIFIYVHGGGWGAETLRQRQADLRWFSERGYLVMSFEYPLATEDRPTWNVTQPLLGCALVWAKANAAQLGGDPARMALWGESAGGNLAINIAYMANAGTLKPACAGSLPKIGAIAALYPVVDPERMYHNPAPLIGVFGRMMTTRYTGGTPAQYPDRYHEIGSATHITAKAPPTLLIIPEADHLVVPEAAYAFAEKASAAGIKARLLRMPFAEHSFDLRSGSIGNQFVRQAMLGFLAENGLEP
ncbi:alpha/beta hydrolase [Novosphingobium sp. MMS21-SN21R]|uniref:alpha/beta hydrolase n=1 Tax=Novosphingobium sp. MMS21-SN21R TaxID=2969298 RepID=UPI002886B109|nr:alpha/beta hydrolase [Novosphingobium sp. MMS21-SN21R]MDT0509896.1 alpha/beta hydrolase [Novosphingobium sp. MMS21-SN21R]